MCKFNATHKPPKLSFYSPFTYRSKLYIACSNFLCANFHRFSAAGKMPRSRHAQVLFDGNIKSGYNYQHKTKKIAAENGISEHRLVLIALNTLDIIAFVLSIIWGSFALTKLLGILFSAFIVLLSERIGLFKMPVMSLSLQG